MGNPNTLCPSKIAKRAQITVETSLWQRFCFIAFYNVEGTGKSTSLSKLVKGFPFIEFDYTKIGKIATSRSKITKIVKIDPSQSCGRIKWDFEFVQYLLRMKGSGGRGRNVRVEGENDVKLIEIFPRKRPSDRLLTRRRPTWNEKFNQNLGSNVAKRVHGVKNSKMTDSMAPSTGGRQSCTNLVNVE